MHTPFIITLDGPAGVGKSTLAQKTAEHFAVAYLDTGAMFRTLGLQLEQHIDLAEKKLNLPDAKLAQCLSSFTFTLEDSGANTQLLCNGENLGNTIRTEHAGLLASIVALNPALRDCLKTVQQNLGKRFSLVAEGRDMGTEVFPKACCKIFLDASAKVRAMRRFRQLQELGLPGNLDELTQQIAERDDKDRNRAIAPLRPAPDATVIDTSELTLDAVLAQIIQTANTALKK